MPASKTAPPAKRVARKAPVANKLEAVVENLTELLRSLEPTIRRNGEADARQTAADLVKSTLAKDTEVTAEKLKGARSAAEEVAATLVKSNADIALELVKSNQIIADSLAHRSDKTDDALKQIMEIHLPKLQQSVALVNLKVSLVFGIVALAIPPSIAAVVYIVFH